MSTNEFSDAFSTAFDPAAAPVTNAECWPIDHSCCQATWDKAEGEDGAYTDAQKTRADLLAAMTMRMLTGYRVGGCPVTVRPCRAGCGGSTWAAYPVGASGPPGVGVYPVYSSGTWLNIGCGCAADGCSCTKVCEVRLSGEVGSVDEVLLDGTVLDPSAYRLDNGNLLTRVDGDCWPLCQDLAAPDTAEGTWSVTYTPGAVVDPLGEFAAGLLACEYVKACAGEDCALPPTVTQIVRQGMTMSLTPGTFSNGLTGIREVDAYILRINPHLLKAPSAVWSPDLNRPRIVG